MGTRFTRRQFLTWGGAGATYFALANAVGCEPAERISSDKPPSANQHVRGVAHASRSSSESGTWAFRSRPDLSPPIVEVAKEVHDTASGYIFIAPEQGDVGQGGSLIIDNKGQVVWFRPLRETLQACDGLLDADLQGRARPYLERISPRARVLE